MLDETRLIMKYLDADFESDFIAHEKGTFRPDFGLKKGDSGGSKASIQAEIYIISCQKLGQKSYMDREMRELVRQYEALKVAIRQKLNAFESEDKIVSDSVPDEMEIFPEPQEQGPSKTQSLIPTRR